MPIADTSFLVPRCGSISSAGPGGYGGPGAAHEETGGCCGGGRCNGEAVLSSPLPSSPSRTPEARHSWGTCRVGPLAARSSQLAYSVVEQSGFQALHSLLQGTPPTCAICHSPVEDPCVTRCVHVACLPCMLAWLRAAPVLQGAPGASSSSLHPLAREAPCPLCRRPFSAAQLIRPDPSLDAAGAEGTGEEGGQGEGEGEEEAKEEKGEEAGEEPRWTPGATQADVDGLGTPEGFEPRHDPRMPALPPPFLAHADAAMARGHVSAKMQALLDVVEGRRGAGDGQTGPLRKVVVFSQFPSSLRVAQDALEAAGVGTAAIGPQMRAPADPSDPSGAQRLSPDEARRQAVTRFNVDPECRVLLLHVGVAAAGECQLSVPRPPATLQSPVRRATSRRWRSVQGGQGGHITSTDSEEPQDAWKKAVASICPQA